MTSDVKTYLPDSDGPKSPPLSRQTFVLLGITVLVTQLPLLFHLPLQLTLPGMLLALIRLAPSLQTRLKFAPVLMTPLVLLSAVAVILHYSNFFARDPCVVFLFLLINFKFIETKRTNDASLIIVLCAFLLLTHFFYWQSIAAAILAIPSMFMIGLSLFSLQRGASTMSLQEMTHVTARLFLQAIPVAALLFVAVPRLPSAGYGSGGAESAVTGLSSRMLPGSVASLTQSNEVAFRVAFEGKPPPSTQRYWRGPVLSGFDGLEWFINENTTTHYVLPATPTGNATTNRQVDYTVTVEPTMNPWLLALDTPISLPVSGDKDGPRQVIGHITTERQINSTRYHKGVYRYRISSLLTDRFRPSVGPASDTLYIADTNPAARKYAMDLRQHFPSDEQLVKQILTFFNKENFFYTLRPQKLGENGIDEFLFSSRRGFCEHYAGSFVFLLRAAGIPARVVTGYQGGEMNGKYMIVRQSDAHAWAEAYINGEWRRFDPTASVARERIESGFNAALGSEMQGMQFWLSQLPMAKSMTLAWDAMNYKWQSWIIDFDSRAQNSIWKRLGLQKPGSWQIALIVALAVAVWTLIIILPNSFSNRRRMDPCEKQWRRLQRRFSSLGVSQHTNESTTSYIERLSQRWPEHDTELRDLLVIYQHGRFSAEARSERSKRIFAQQMNAILLQLGRVR